MSKKFRIFIKSTVIVAIEIVLITLTLFSIIDINENQLLYLSSTLSQVVATLFGLTITGYIFLEDRLKSSSEKDDTLIDAIDALKLEFRKSLLTIGVLTGISIIFCLSNMIIGNNLSSIPAFMADIVLYNSIAITIATIIFIIKFVFKVTDPQKIKKISAKEKTAIEKSNHYLNKQDTNYFSQFMQEFNKLEKLLIKHAEKYSNNASALSFYQALRIIQYNELLDNGTIKELQQLRKYRNYAVHGDSVFVEEFAYNSLSHLTKHVEKKLELNN